MIKKRIMAFSLALIMCLTLIGGLLPSGIVRAETVSSGTYYGIDWELDADGNLTLQGGTCNDTYGPKWKSNNVITITLNGEIIANNSFCTNVFRNSYKLKTINNLDKLNTSNITNMNNMFSGCQSLLALDVSSFNTSNVTNMSYMFDNCQSLPSLDVSSFNTSNVTNMSNMFAGCLSLQALNLSNFNTNNVTNMISMFSQCKSLQSLDISSFNTSNVTNMSNMFAYCLSLQALDVSSFNTSNVTNMSNMFAYCQSIQALDVSSFNTSNVTNMKGMFQDCHFLQSLDLSSFNTSNVTDMSNMFQNCYSLTSLDVSSFNTTNVTNMSYMFNTCYSLPLLDVSNFNTSNVTDMTMMFQNCYSLTSLNLSNFNTSNVTKMRDIFQRCFLLQSLDLSNWDISNVTYMDSISCPLNILKTPKNLGNKQPSFGGLRMYDVNGNEYTKINVENTTLYGYQPLASSGTYYGIDWELDTDGNLTLQGGTCNNIGGLKWNTKAVSTVTINGEIIANDYFCKQLFSNSYNLKTINNLDKLNTSNVTDMSGIFIYCPNLQLLDLSNWNTSNVTNMSNMFTGCQSLQSLDLSNWNTSNVTNMFSMFNDCSSLKSLDVSNWDTSNVTNMICMFQDCHNLQSLDLSSFNTSNITNMGSIFQNCHNLQSLDVSNWDTSNVTYMGYMFENCFLLQSLDLSNWDMSNVTNLNNMFLDCSFNIIKTPKNLGNQYPYFNDAKKMYDINGNVYSQMNVANTTLYRPAPTIYTITYNLNEGTAINNTTYTQYDTFTLNNPTRDNYEFIGWSGTGLIGENNMTVNIPQDSTGDREYTAHWRVLENTITFDKQSGVGGSSSISASNGQPMSAIEIPTRDGYTFLGYFDSSDVKYYNTDGSSAKNWDKDCDTTLYAHWEKDNYTITYNLDGGNIEVGQPENPTNYAVDSTTFTLTNPTKVGYDFIGWTGTGLTEPTMNVTISQGSIGNREYTANYQPKEEQGEQGGGNNYTPNINPSPLPNPEPSTDPETTPEPSPSPEPNPDPDISAGEDIIEDTDVVETSKTETTFNATFGEYLPSVTPPTSNEYGKNFAGFVDNNNIKYIDENGKGIKKWDKTEGTATLYEQWHTKTTDINTVNINVSNPIIISSVENDGNVLFDIDTSNSFYNITNSHIVSGVNENEKMASGDIEHYAKLTLTIPDELFNGENKINFNENTVVNINGEPNAKVVKVESINEPTNEITLIIKNTNAMGLTIYRLYNPYDGDHIHTDSLNAKNLLESWGWNFEGISSIASTDGDAVYRLYNPYSGEHFFTASEIERFILLVKGWNDEGIAFYSPSNQGDAVHRLYNPNSGLHHFTKDIGEKDWLVLSGWNYEGIAWYEMK